MSTIARFQNPVVGSTVALQLFTYNSNVPSDFYSVVKVDIYFLDPTLKSESNPDGRRVVQEILSDGIQHIDTGIYEVDVLLTGPLYTIGKYIDVWTVEVENNDVSSTIENRFQIFPNLWYTSPKPLVADFTFAFHPNKMRVGEQKYITIDITPNVPRASDLERYYEQLAIVSPLQINIQQSCGNCLPAESDLRTVVTNDPVTLRDKNVGYYFLDTTDMGIGVYDVWFNMSFGGSLYISEKQQLQII